jgi:2-polyprenyl-3-methyl-5-hydroxy-6-metoxy-1,4-benzoquinol methylase
VPRFRAEAPWAWRLLQRYALGLPCGRRVETPGRRPTVADAAGEAAAVLALADPESYLLPEAARRLVDGLKGAERWDVVVPVTNEPWAEEARSAPPFAYSTPSLLAEAVRFMSAIAPELRPARAPDSPVFAARREVLAALPKDLPLDLVPREAHQRGARVAIDPGAYLHRYAEMDAQAREDLAEKVPPGAVSVLDVGCSRGATAKALKARGVRRIVGIEPDPEDAKAAALVYERVLPVRLEAVSEEFPGEFDAVLFGDVLEHLVDPSAALVRVRPWLSIAGVLIASVPNLGHWAVVADLLEGKFDYVPYSILSGTHLRFFTRRTVTDLFEACGYRVETVDTVTLPVSSEGEKKLARLSRLPGASADLSAAEFLVVARPEESAKIPSR